MNQKTKQIIIVIILIIVSFVGYKMFFPANNSIDSLVEDQSENANFVDGQTILVLLNKLNQVVIDESIFSNDIFVSLVSFERPIAEQVVGRPNPFLPIGVDSSSASFPLSTSTTGTI